MTESLVPPTVRAPVAVVTGASRGLGLALATGLTRRGWHVVVDARDQHALTAATADLPPDAVTAVPGDVTDTAHRGDLTRAARAAGGARLLVNNASVIGPSPQPSLADYPADALAEVFAVNTFAPLAMAQELLGQLRENGGTIVNISSDAAVEAYPGWGGYGSAKAALDQLTAVLAAENPTIRILAFDPGDMNTVLHQQAEPDEDLSDLPAPETVVPALLELIEGTLPSGRYRSSDFAKVPS